MAILETEKLAQTSKVILVLDLVHITTGQCQVTTLN